jgi:hypothetical protein
VVVTGYFARLASRTGVGQSAPTAQRDTKSLLEREDVVTFVAQTKLPGAVVAPSSEPATAPQPEPAEPSRGPSATSAPARFVVPDTPDITRATELDLPRLIPESRASDEPRGAVTAPRSTSREPLAEARFAIPGPGPEAVGAVEAETRVVGSAMAGSPAPASVKPRAADPMPQRAPLMQAVPPEQSAERARATQLTSVERVVDATALAPHPVTPELRRSQEQRPQFVKPRDPAPSQPANGRAQPRLQAAPLVRIGSIRVDVHAAPASQPARPQPQPAPPAPSPPRALSLRRFYVRDW